MNALYKRYALALFKSHEKDDLEKLLNELYQLKEIFNKNKQLYGLLINPTIDRKLKMDAFNKGTNLDKEEHLLYEYLRILIDKGRISEFDGIADEFERIYLESLGIIQVTIETAKTLSNKELEKLKTEIEEKLSSKVKMYHTVNPELVAGMKIIISDKVYDGSLLGRMKQIYNNIIKE